MKNRTSNSKAKFIIFFLAAFAVNQANAIGFPHGYSKKKKVEQASIIKKKSNFERKIIFVGSLVSAAMEKYFEYLGKN